MPRKRRSSSAGKIWATEIRPDEVLAPWYMGRCDDSHCRKYDYVIPTKRHRALCLECFDRVSDTPVRGAKGIGKD